MTLWPEVDTACHAGPCRIAACVLQTRPGHSSRQQSFAGDASHGYSLFCSTCFKIWGSLYTTLDPSACSKGSWQPVHTPHPEPQNRAFPLSMMLQWLSTSILQKLIQEQIMYVSLLSAITVESFIVRLTKNLTLIFSIYHLTKTLCSWLLSIRHNANGEKIWGKLHC